MLTALTPWQQIDAELARLPSCANEVSFVGGMLAACFIGGHKLLLCGNGGSAADCQHLAAEFVSGLHRDKRRRALPAVALTTDTSVITASANDYGYDGVFGRQVDALGQKHDILLAISTSGNSENVVQAAQAGKRAGMTVVALTGPDGGRLGLLADVTIHAPGANTQRVQESMLLIEHLLAEMVECVLFGGSGDSD